MEKIVQYAIFASIVVFFLWKIRKSYRENRGDWGMDFETPFWSLLLIIFLVAWGGIFWW